MKVSSFSFAGGMGEVCRAADATRYQANKATRRAELQSLH